MSVKQNILRLQETILRARERQNFAGAKDLGAVKLIAVTKNQPVAKILEAIEAGADIIGENRVQEAKTKFAQMTEHSKISRHLIGHLQTNKAKQAVELFDLIHSVDSERIALAIDSAAAKLDKRQDILIQVNVGEEDSKQGILPILKSVEELARFCSKLENLRLCGLMAIAPFYEEPEKTRPLFKELKTIFDELCLMNIPNTNFKWLSMGMTHDYEVAVEEGANLVRIGTGIFGDRHY